MKTIIYNPKPDTILPSLKLMLQAEPDGLSEHIKDSCIKAKKMLVKHAEPWVMMSEGTTFIEESGTHGFHNKGPLLKEQNINLEKLHSMIPDCIPLHKTFKAASAAAVFSASLGSGPEQEASDAFNRGDYTLGGLIDRGASLMVDELTQFLERKMMNWWIQEGFSNNSYGKDIALSYCPGYCGWSVSVQQDLLNMQPEAMKRLKTNESGMLYPVKSVVGILLIADRKSHTSDFSFECCQKCKQRICLTRINEKMRGESE